MVNACYFTYQLYNDTNFYSSLNLNNPAAERFFNACLYETSSGDFKDVFDVNPKSAVTSYANIYQGISAYDYYNTNYSTKRTEPKAITDFKTELANKAAFTLKENDFMFVSTEHRYTTV